MSWSTACNGKFGIASEAHRVGIVTELVGNESTNADTELLSRLYELSFRHFIFKLKCTERQSVEGSFLTVNLLKNLVFLRSLSKTPNPLQDAPLYITVISDIIDAEFWRTFFRAVCSEIESVDINCLVVELQTYLAGNQLSSFAPMTYAADLAKVNEISDLLVNIKAAQLACSSPCPFFMGIDGIYDRGILQLLLEQPIGMDLQLVLPGSLQLPNIKFRIIDFIHSRGLNTMHIPSDNVLLNWAQSPDQAPIMFTLLKKYPQCKNRPAPIIVKFLVQLGIIVGVSATLGAHFIEEMVAPVIHPFANRKEFCAPSITKRFVIEVQDVEALKQESEEVECKEDEIWRKAYLFRNPPRKLTDALN